MTQGPEHIGRCAFQVAIVSAGLIVRQSTEAIVLKRIRVGTFILDESHKARRRGQLGVDDLELNSLIGFMIRMANNARHVLLCTATPIHTAVRERWDLLMILNQNADFVMERDHASSWRFWQLVPSFRSDLNMADKQFHLSDAPTALTPFARSDLQSAIKTNFFQRSNPFVRHDGLRRRKTLEDAGLLEKIAVDIHPDPEALSGTYPGVTFVGRGLMTNRPFELAYEAAEAFIDVFSKHTKSAKLLRSVFLQRIFSSFQSGRLIHAVEVLDLVIAAVPGYAPAKSTQWQKGYELRENQLALVHGDPLRMCAKDNKAWHRRSNRDQTEKPKSQGKSLTYDALM